MSNHLWARRINQSGKQYRCGSCGGVIDRGEEYFQVLSQNCKFCCDCQPEPDEEIECWLA